MKMNIKLVGGPDLQERKKFLVANTDALIVLPGGPGTWDELWEMACARHLNLNKLPIVCVNVDGYYEPFRDMLHRAYSDKLIHLPPDDIVIFASGAEDAVRFVEGQDMEEVATRNQRKPNVDSVTPWYALTLTFFAGTLLGIAMTKSRVGRG
jgi:predicted Rossmann-fold nucleotide-binding protein